MRTIGRPGPASLEPASLSFTSPAWFGPMRVRWKCDGGSFKVRGGCARLWLTVKRSVVPSNTGLRIGSAAVAALDVQGSFTVARTCRKKSTAPDSFPPSSVMVSVTAGKLSISPRHTPTMCDRSGCCCWTAGLSWQKAQPHARTSANAAKTLGVFIDASYFSPLLRKLHRRRDIAIRAMDDRCAVRLKHHDELLHDAGRAWCLYLKR